MIAVLLGLLILFDLQNLIALFRRPIPLADERSDDFTIVVPIFGHPRYLANLDFLEGLRDNTMVVVNLDNDDMVATADCLETDGYQVVRTEFSGRVAVSRMWQAGLREVRTTYAVRFDGDTRTDDDVGCAVRSLELEHVDFATAKVYVTNPRTLAERLQATEYRISMQSRHFRQWMASGACIMGRTDALLHILEHHTHWWNGEDVEQGIIAKHFKMRVRHVDMRVYTDVPPTFKALYRQRCLWWAGSVRQSLVNADQMLWFPAVTLYNLMLVYLGFSLRAYNILLHPLTMLMGFPAILVLYVFLTSVANHKVWSPWFLVFPLYSLVQTTVMPASGFYRYVITARRAGNLGRYKIGFVRRAWTA